MAGDVVLGVTDTEAAATARVWATARAERLGVGVREVLVTSAHDDLDEVVAAVAGAEMLVLPAAPGHPYRALIAAVHCPVAVVPVVGPGPRAGVLVGVDSSEVSGRALAFAAAEAERIGEPLIALAAWEPVVMGTEPGMDLWTGALPVDLSEATAGMLESMLEPVRAAHPGLDVDARVEVGDPSSIIADASREVVVTVVGSHGRTGLARLLLGSTSEHVAEHVDSVAVLVR